MKNLVLGIVASLFMFTSAMAEVTMVVPQKPGQGTTGWADIVYINLVTLLGAKITRRLIPGPRDIPSINACHNDLRFDENTIVVTQGGIGVSFF